MQIYDALGTLFTNAQFAALFSPTGQPAEASARLALVLVIQFLEGLSDRQAAQAVRDRIAWQYALGLELTDSGFDASALSEFRDRLIAGQVEQLLLDSLLERLQSLACSRPVAARELTQPMPGGHSYPQPPELCGRDHAPGPQCARGRGPRLAARPRAPRLV
jgi:Transposase domain (DUF772)